MVLAACTPGLPWPLAWFTRLCRQLQACSFSLLWFWREREHFSFLSPSVECQGFGLFEIHAACQASVLRLWSHLL